ncbi:MAG: Gfo/Idh/MocA family oxidoreductase [Chloroflexota bacterium]|nr:Gfo/Idh/MocA family oxidoreductase [Chloroflexota bacterium]
MVETLRFGLIGCGQQGRQLVTALKTVAATRLIACSDPDPTSLRSVAGADVARYADYRAMLDQAELDAVLVATTHSALADATMAVVDRGRHAFCEKPLATSARSAWCVVDAARRTNVNLMVGYIQRFDPLRRQMKAILEGGALGTLSHVVAGKGGPPFQGGWHLSRAHGGGQLLWVGSHLTDQLHWLLGRRVERVFAEIQRSPANGTDLTTVATLRLEGGLLAHLDCSSAADDVYDYIEAVGLEGHARSEWRPDYRLIVQSQRIPGYETPRGLAQAPLTIEAGCIAELSEFASSIREARPPAVTGEDAVRVLVVLDAIVLSAESGQPVTLPNADDA